MSKKTTLIDETGNQYGNYTVLERDTSKKGTSKHNVFWKCQCKCGNLRSIRSDNLRRLSNDAKCRKCNRLAPHNEINETGNVYGLLTVLYKDKEKSLQEQGTWWACRCECGTILSFSGPYLRQGNIKHCGDKIHTRPNLIGNIYNENIKVIVDDYEDEVYCECLLCGDTFYRNRHDLTNVKSCGCLVHRPQSTDEVGNRYGNLVVIEEGGYRKSISDGNDMSKKQWLCLCDCGNTRIAEGTALRLGRTTMCLECGPYEIINGKRASNQQKAIAEMLGISKDFVNYIVLGKRVDVVDVPDNILIEYDGWTWHEDTHKTTDKFFDRQATDAGWKILRIKSGTLLPTEQELRAAIAKLNNGSIYEEIVLNDWKLGEREEDWTQDW